MRLALSTALVMVSLIAVGATLHAQFPYSGYPTAPYSTGPYQGTGMYCSNFVLKQGSNTLMSNASGPATTSPYNTYYGGVTPGNLIPGAAHSIQVTMQGQYNTYATAWIDYNNDGDFLDSGEYLGPSTSYGSNGSTVTINFTVPTAFGGVKRLRMRTNYSSPATSSTSSYSYGEAEDYLVNLGFALETSSPLPVGALTQAYSADIKATNGVGTYNWANGNGILSGSLPAGLTATKIANDTVRIQGTPTAITPTGNPASFTISVTDSDSPPETAQKVYTITILPQPVSLPFFEDFSNPVGWQIEGPWQIGSATSFSQSSPPCSEPGTDHTAATSDNKILGDTIGGLYTANVSTMYYATSPMVSCIGASTVRVRFFGWLGLAIGSETIIEISTNGNTWSTVWASTSGASYGTKTTPTWDAYAYDISAQAAGQGTVQVRIGLGPLGSTRSTGWCIDDFMIEVPADDLTVVEQATGGGPGPQIHDDDAPAGARDFGTVAKGTNNGPITFYITNNGPKKIKFGSSTVPVFTKSGNNPTEFYVSAGGMLNPLEPGQTTTFGVTFNSGSGTGTYSMTLELNHDADYSGTTPFDINFTANAQVLAPSLEVRLNSSTGPTVAHDLAATSSPARDFGQQDINAGPTSPVTVTIMNTGTGPMSLTTPDMSGYYNDYVLNTSGVVSQIAAGASVDITVAFDPTSVGQKDAKIRIFTNDPGAPYPYLVPVTGMGTTSNLAGLEVFDGPTTGTPLSHNASPTGVRNFGNQLVAAGPTPAITITISNPGGAQLVVGTPTLGGTAPGEFVLDTSGFNGNVASGGTTSFTIAFDPTTTGQKTATVEFTHNATTATTPFIINVVGTGVNTAPQMVVHRTNAAGATITNGTTPGLDFGTQDVNAGPVVETIFVENTGTAALTVAAPSLTTTTTEYTVSVAGFAGTIPVNGNATFTITFDPTVAGTHTAAIEFTHNDASSGSPFVLNVTGDATLNAPIIEVREDSTVGPLVASGEAVTTTSSRYLGTVDVNIGSSLPVIMVIKNSGNLALVMSTPVLAGPDAAQFTLGTSGFVNNLAAGADTGFSVSCDPTTGGNKDCWVEFTQNDPGHPATYVVRIRCTGDDPSAVQISTAALPFAISGQTYPFFQMQAVQATGALTWSIYDGALPAGLTMDAFGLITGTPSGFGSTSDVTIRVADAGTGATHERQYSFVVQSDFGGRRADSSGCVASESSSTSLLALLALVGIGAFVVSVRRREA